MSSRDGIVPLSSLKETYLLLAGSEYLGDLYLRKEEGALY
tara:strand:- start:434 stop:553 length:120 start_codon:yes stop_codon:yes gene_type:complete